MTTIVYDLTEAWQASNRITASGNTDLNVSNPEDGSNVVRWATTDTDAAPVLPPDKANPIPPLGDKAMQLQDTKRLWLAGRGTANVEIV